MKRVSMIVLLSLLLSLLAACGGGGGDTATSGSSAAPSVENALASGAAESAPASMAASAEASTEASAEASSAGEAATGTSGGAIPDLGGRTVAIGSDTAYPPFESVDPATNEIVGFDVDLLNAIGELANFTPEFQTAAFDTIFTALQQGQFDAVVSAVTITPERAELIDFSDPYIDVGQLVVVGADNTAITRYQDLANAAAVGVQTGTTGETAALEEGGVPDANLKRYQTIDLAFNDLANGAIDAVVADGPTVGNYTSQPQLADRLKIVGEPFTTEQYGIAVQKGDTELLDAINAALAQLKGDGTIDQLREKWQIK